jgi:hypothetical protein
MQWVLSRAAYQRYVAPHIADMQYEYEIAYQAGAPWKARWIVIRGYCQILRKNHHLVLGWPDPRVDREFRVSATVYHQYDTTRCAQVTWHHGYLNDPFLSGMRPVPCEAPFAVE